MNCTTLGVDVEKNVFQLHGVNERELLINVVRSDKPKTLTGLSQKGTWSGVSDSFIPYRRQHDHRRTGGT